MTIAKNTFIFLALLLLGNALHAQQSANALPTITDAWVRTTVPGGSVSGAYMQINATTPLKLVRVESPIAGLIELHETRMKNGVMEMKALDSVDIPAGKKVTLKPGGMHVMMMKVANPILSGDKVPLTLTFLGADKKTIQMKIDAVAKEKDGGAHHH